MVQKKILRWIKERKNETDTRGWDLLRLELIDDLKSYFKPEFINRLDDIVIFKALGQQQIQNIVKILLNNSKALISGVGIDITFSPKVIEYLSKQGFDPLFGARPLKRIIQREIENPLSEKILSEKFSKGDKIQVELINNQINFKKSK